MYTTAIICAVGLSVALANSEVPKCDPDLIQSLGPSQPKDKSYSILENMKKEDSYSFMMVPTGETILNARSVKCIGVQMKDDNTANVCHNFNLGASETKTYPLAEENNVIMQYDEENKKMMKIYMLTTGPGLFCTMRCCDTCTGTEPNVGMLVADSKKDSEETKKAMEDCKEKFKQLGIKKGLTSLKSCSKSK